MNVKEPKLTQFAHVVISAAIVFFIMFVVYTLCLILNGFNEPKFSPDWKFILLTLATTISMIIAGRREWNQHPGECGHTCIVDLIFRFIGCLIMDIIIFNIM